MDTVRAQYTFLELGSIRATSEMVWHILRPWEANRDQQSLAPSGILWDSFDPWHGPGQVIRECRARAETWSPVQNKGQDVSGRSQGLGFEGTTGSIALPKVKRR